MLLHKYACNSFIIAVARATHSVFQMQRIVDNQGVILLLLHRLSMQHCKLLCTTGRAHCKHCAASCKKLRASWRLWSNQPRKPRKQLSRGMLLWKKEQGSQSRCQFRYDLIPSYCSTPAQDCNFILCVSQSSEFRHTGCNPVSSMHLSYGSKDPLGSPVQLRLSGVLVVGKAPNNTVLGISLVTERS